MDPRRQPQNLQGLLKFALEYTRSEDAPNPSQFDQMDPERRKFLEEALKSMTVDVIEEFEKAIGILENSGHSLEEEIEALNVIRDYIDSIDFANNFIKIGGSKIILDKLKSKNTRLRTCAAYIIAEMSQNNPFSQQHFIELDVLPILVSYLTENEDVASASMHAISSLVRQYEPGCAAFIELGGLECLLGSLQNEKQNENSKLFIKACFLISTLSTEYPAVRDELIKLGAIEKLCWFVEAITGFEIKIECVLSALNVLIQSDEGKSRMAQTNLAGSLRTLVDCNVDKPECEEMIEYSKNLLRCFDRAEQPCADR